MKTVTVSSKGQIAIPKDIRKAAGIERGEELVLLYKDGKFLVERAEDIITGWTDEEWKEFSRQGLAELWEDEDALWDKPENSSDDQPSVHRPKCRKKTSSTRRVKQ